MSNILITGGNGYIGSHLVKKLIDLQNRVIVIKRTNSNLEYLDGYLDKITFYNYLDNLQSVLEIFKKEKPKYVLHLASKSFYDYNSFDIDEIINSNIKFGMYILEAMSQYEGTIFINAASWWQNKIDEDNKPNNLYSATKQALEEILKFYSERRKIKTISLRLPDVYGLDDRRNKILNLIKYLPQGKKILLTKGEQEMDLLYIDDVINGFIMAIRVAETMKNFFEVYCLTSGRKIELKKVVEEISLYKKDVIFAWGEIPYRKDEIMKITIPKKVLPIWKPKISLEKGIYMFMTN